jgi:hypothetical protein
MWDAVQIHAMEDELMDGFRVLPLFIKVFLKISTS